MTLMISPGLSSWELVFRLALAAIIGAIFGYERKKSKKPAGIRTHVLISLASCMVALVSAYGFAGVYSPELVGINFNIDPARLVVGVLTGIGFIGGGIIWKSTTGVIGITTAAEIFFLAALGIAIGLGLYLLAGVAALIAIITLVASDIKQLMPGKRKAEAADDAIARQDDPQEEN
ncbi:MAG: MgtC/SapB family protein [Clostridia bacterium]|nr:MgtC/SapB family protein [Clostridia bacterium]